ncbi:hypothetical protein J6590_001194 [Homalodisca vitripennis]|nr:hypothetical protein J6590_001194 [Homalodisca vitripennis]
MLPVDLGIVVHDQALLHNRRDTNTPLLHRFTFFLLTLHRFLSDCTKRFLQLNKLYDFRNDVSCFISGFTHANIESLHLNLFEKKPSYREAMFFNILPESLGLLEKTFKTSLRSWLLERPTYTIDEFVQ